MNKVIEELFPTLPTDVCNIIYQYNKPQYLDFINSLNRFELNEIAGICGWTRLAFTKDTYILHRDNFRYNILGSQRWRCLLAFKLHEKHVAFDDYYNRDDLKQKCRDNGIEFKDRTPTKNLIKKLMKL